MKVTFDKQDLLAALIPAAGISQAKNTLAAVDGLLFECPPNARFGEYDGEDRNVCRISAFDLEKGLRTTVKCRIEEEGLYVINTAKILQIVRSLPDGDVTISIDERGRVTLKSGFSQFEITATPGDEFPSMPRFVGESRFEVPQHKLRTLIGETVFSVAANDQRAAFTGALFRLENSMITMVGCDGFRLSAARYAVDRIEVGEKTEIIIPGKFLTELYKLLRDTEDEVEVIIGHKNIIFRVDDMYFFTRMLDTEYLPYENLLPQTYMTQAYVSRDELLSAVERASIISEDKLGGSGRVHVKLVIEGDGIAMSSVSAGGSVYDKIPAAIDGAPLTIGFTCRYLLEAIRACPPECATLRIRFNSPLMGVVIEPSGGTSFLNAKPDASVYGESAAEERSGEKKEDGEENSFMFFVLPRRMNN